MPESILFVTGFIITSIVVAGCLKLGREEERAARERARERASRGEQGAD